MSIERKINNFLNEETIEMKMAVVFNRGMMFANREVDIFVEQITDDIKEDYLKALRKIVKESEKIWSEPIFDKLLKRQYAELEKKYGSNHPIPREFWEAVIHIRHEL